MNLNQENFNNILKSALENVAQIAEDHEESHQPTKAIENTYLELAQIHKDFGGFQDSFNELCGRILDGPESVPKDAADEITPSLLKEEQHKFRLEILREFDQMKEERHQLDPSALAGFKERLWIVNHPDEMMPREDAEDAELSISGVKQSFICPLTTSQLVDPVKNPACGHLYSRDAIRQYLNGNRGNCPVSGCSKTITLSTLLSDMTISKRIEQMNKPKIFA